MEPLAEPLLLYPQRDTLLAQAGASAAEVDAGRAAPFDLLRRLGTLGLLELGRSGSLLPMCAVVYDLASECVASAFSLWGHRMAVVYHDAAGTELPVGVLSAERAAVSVMAPAFKSAAGLSDLLALNATRSAALQFTDVFIPTADIMTDDLPVFLTAVRGPFLLLQVAFCLGLAAAALNSAVAGLGGVNKVFRTDAQEVSSEYRRLRRQLVAMAEDSTGQAKLALLKLRLDAALLAGAATRLEANVVGGRGYQSRSPTARRLREAAFLPVQAPTEGHLRWEIQHSQ